MPSNKELTEEATFLGGALSVDVATNGLNHDALEKLVASLKAQVDALPALPAEHKRPTTEEFVASGYQAESYERHMLGWEIELRRKLALPPDGAVPRTETGAPTPPPPAVNATPSGDPPPPPVDGAAPRTETGAPTPPPAAPPAQLYDYQVAHGKALLTLRGNLGPGQEITARDISDGAEGLKRLVAKGYVTTKAAPAKS